MRSRLFLHRHSLTSNTTHEVVGPILPSYREISGSKANDFLPLIVREVFTKNDIPLAAKFLG